MIEKRAFDLDEQDRIARRTTRLEALAPAEQEATRNAINLSDVKQQKDDSAFPQRTGAPAPVIARSVTQAIPSPKIETPSWHEDTITAAPKVGSFCGTPIVEVNFTDAETTAHAMFETVEDTLRAYDEQVIAPMASELLAEEKHRVQEIITGRKGTIVAVNGNSDRYAVCFDELKGDLLLSGKYDNGVRNIPVHLLKDLKGELYVS
jgi:hypothetical protein